MADQDPNVPQQPKKELVEGVDYPVIRIGDKVKVVKKDIGKLQPVFHNYLLSRNWFEVKGISLDARGLPSIDIGYRIYGDKPFYYPVFRFALVEEGDIDPNDPYGEEKWEVTSTFENHVIPGEKKALEKIEANISKLWINKNDLSSIVKVVGIDENEDTYKYIIRYSVFKIKNKDEVNSAESFLKSFDILSSNLIPELEGKITSAEENYKQEIDEHQKQYEYEVKKAEERLKQSTNDSERKLKLAKDKFFGAIEMCRKIK